MASFQGTQPQALEGQVTCGGLPMAPKLPLITQAQGRGLMTVSCPPGDWSCLSCLEAQ